MARRSARSLSTAILPFAWILLQSCGGSSDAEKLDDAIGGAAGTPAEAGIGGAAQGGSSNAGASNGGAAGSAGTVVLDGGTDTDASIPDSSACTSKTQAAVPAALDVYILLDATASMTDTVNGAPAWPALTTALVAAISDPKNAGMRVGLTFLPNPPPSGFQVPGSCSTNADCGTGTCQSFSTLGIPGRACSPGCTADSDCGAYGPCQTFGSFKFCNGALVQSVSCDPADYGQPAVGIDLLPGNQLALSNAIQGKTADGEATPTQPALKGTLSYATAWAETHADHIVQVLLATDGMPTSCTGNTIDESAQAAAESYKGYPSVATFVLNVNASANLEPIAVSGGTKQAVLANASTVGLVVPALFDSIRAGGACSFQIPAPQPGQTFDPGLVDLTLTEPGSSDEAVVAYVGSAVACDPVSGGWYYYPDPGIVTPTLIVACPATCTQIHAGAKAETLIGCSTENQD